MARAWPFENKPEAGGAAEKYKGPDGFAAARGEGIEAVVVRIGGNDALLVLVDASGAWDHWVYHDKEEALGVANALGITVHEDEYPEALRVRMNARQRTAAEFDRGAYPEQGPVGPLKPYPENRPRQLDQETPEGASAQAVE